MTSVLRKPWILEEVTAVINEQPRAKYRSLIQVIRIEPHTSGQQLSMVVSDGFHFVDAVISDENLQAFNKSQPEDKPLNKLKGCLFTLKEYEVNVQNDNVEYVLSKLTCLNSDNSFTIGDVKDVRGAIQKQRVPSLPPTKETIQTDGVDDDFHSQDSDYLKISDQDKAKCGNTTGFLQLQTPNVPILTQCDETAMNNSIDQVEDSYQENSMILEDKEQEETISDKTIKEQTHQASQTPPQKSETPKQNSISLITLSTFHTNQEIQESEDEDETNLSCLAFDNLLRSDIVHTLRETPQKSSQPVIEMAQREQTPHSYSTLMQEELQMSPNSSQEVSKVQITPERNSLQNESSIHSSPIVASSDGAASPNNSFSYICTQEQSQFNDQDEDELMEMCEDSVVMKSPMASPPKKKIKLDDSVDVTTNPIHIYDSWLKY
ncbi:Vcan, partial [Acrasis kona]